MSATMLGVLGIFFFLFLLMTGMPVSFSMFATGIIGIAMMRDLSSAFLMTIDSITATFSSFVLTVAPMFILMGILAGHTGIGEKLVHSANAFLGHWRGGLASGVQVVAALFGAICGSMPANIATVGSIAYPVMKKLGYSDRLSTGAICAGAALAALIPPSLTFIIYATATQLSVGKLFASGITTGILLLIIYIITIQVWCKVNPSLAPKIPALPWKDRIRTLKGSGIIEIAVVFGISMGGLFGGLFTPTESGAVGVFGVMLVTLISRRLTFRIMLDALRDTIRLSCFIYFLIAGASIYSKFFTFSQIPAALGNLLSGSGLSAFAIMALITLTYWVLGCVIDDQALVLLSIPVFYPIVTSLGFDGIWFGAYTVVIVGVGGLTPPAALLTYVMHRVAKEQVPLSEIFIGVAPFMVSGFLMLFILILFPQIVLFIPNMM